MSDARGMAAALAISSAGRCKRRQIGAAISDEDGYVLVVAANGPPDCMASCFDEPCPAADVPAGQGNATTACYGVHAEMRALVRMNDARRARSIYCTKAPCTTCTRTLLDTSIKRVIFMTASNETTNRDLWQAAGREWKQFDGTMEAAE